MFLILHDQVLRDRLKDILYGRIVVDYIPQKEEPHKTRLTFCVCVGGWVGGGVNCVCRICKHTKGRHHYNKSNHQQRHFHAGARYMCCDIKQSTWGHL